MSITRAEAMRADMMAAVRRLIDALARRGARKVNLFGSLADGAPVGPDSDVDLMVVMPGVEQERFHQRLSNMDEIAEFPYALDLLVYSPAEWEEMQRRSFIQNEVIGKGSVLFRDVLAISRLCNPLDSPQTPSITRKKYA